MIVKKLAQHANIHLSSLELLTDRFRHAATERRVMCWFPIVYVVLK